MGTIPILLLSLAMLSPAAEHTSAPANDPPHLREMLYDSQHPRDQSQAALLLVRDQTAESRHIVCLGLRQTEFPEVFQALASAIRLCPDARFIEDLLAALSSDPPVIRQAAVETLAALADPRIAPRLRAVIDDPHLDLATRQAMLRALGRSGRKSVVVILVDDLASDNEAIRRSAAEGLAELSGQAYGMDLDRWHDWWERHEDMADERWLAERLAYQASRACRLEGDLERSRAEVVRLEQQLYSRLPVADRLAHVQSLVEHEDTAVRLLAVTWSVELLPVADTLGQRALGHGLLRLSRDSSPEVQRPAVLALGRVNDAHAFERLETLLQESSAPVRAAAARALTQQAQASGPEAPARRRQVVSSLQKALDDASLELVVEAAEDLGTLGVPEASPVLAALLRHPSRPVRQTAAQALERVADPTVLHGLLAALDDSAVTVRFSLVGAIGHVSGDGRSLTETERGALLARLEGVLVHDADPGVRSRAATVLGECGSPDLVPSLWQRVVAGEDSRVQEKAWMAIIEIIAREGSLDLLRQWDRTLAEAKEGSRRVQLLTETSARWQKREDMRQNLDAVLEALVQAELAEGKWTGALPLVRDLLGRAATDSQLTLRLQWWLAVGEQAFKEGSRPEALRVVEEARPFLLRSKDLAAEFNRLEQQARQEN